MTWQSGKRDFCHAAGAAQALRNYMAEGSKEVSAMPREVRRGLEVTWQKPKKSASHAEAEMKRHGKAGKEISAMPRRLRRHSETTWQRGAKRFLPCYGDCAGAQKLHGRGQKPKKY